MYRHFPVLPGLVKQAGKIEKNSFPINRIFWGKQRTKVKERE